MSPLPKDLNLKNLTALELHRFVGEQMKLSSRATRALIPLSLRTMDEATDEERKQQVLKQKRFQMRVNGRKEIITNQVNYTHIENPFKDYSMTLQTLKKERH